MPLEPQAVWRIAVARTRLKHDDPLLRHKTTRRQVYIAAREEYSTAEVDEVILLNDLDEVCEGTITSIFLDIGVPLASLQHCLADCSTACCDENF